jgi:ribosome-binding factor A
MLHDDSRLRRVEDQLQREVATMIQREMKDPRVAMVTVTAVEVTRELEQATIFVTLLNGDEASSKVPVKVLNNAAGFMRREIGRRLRLRHVPALKFKYDASIEKGNRVSRLIQQAREEDEARQAAGRGEGATED